VSRAENFFPEVEIEFFNIIYINFRLQLLNIFCWAGSNLQGKKAKAIPLLAWTGPEVSRSLRLPDFKTIGA
jgi:hypothetical protein